MDPLEKLTQPIHQNQLERLAYRTWSLVCNRRIHLQTMENLQTPQSTDHLFTERAVIRMLFRIPRRWLHLLWNMRSHAPSHGSTSRCRFPNHPDYPPSLQVTIPYPTSIRSIKFFRVHTDSTSLGTRNDT